MVFHWSLSDNKFSRVSRTLPSILSDINNAVVWTVSIRPVISKSSSPCNNPMVTVLRAPITIGIIVTFMFHSLFNSLARSKYLLLFSNSFNITLWSTGTAKSTILLVRFYVDYYMIWSSGWDLVIRLYLKIPEEFVYVILQDRFWMVHIPFVRIVKLQILAQFPVDHLAHPVVPSLILFLL